MSKPLTKEQTKSKGELIYLPVRYGILHKRGKLIVEPLEVTGNFRDGHWEFYYHQPLCYCYTNEVIEEFPSKEQAEARIKELRGEK